MAKRRASSDRITIQDEDWIAGDGGYEDIPERELAPWRLRLEAGAEREVVFLDGDGLFSKREPFPFYEHHLRIDGKWGNFVTCISGKKDGKNLCFMCTPRMRKYTYNNRSYMGAYTVIVTTPYKIKKGKRKGKVVKNTKMLLCAKPTVLKTLKRKKEKHGVFVGQKWTTYRPEGDSANTGTDWEFTDHVVDPDWVRKMAKKGDEGFDEVMDAIAEELGIDDPEGEIVQPFNYKELFYPKPWEELEEEYGYLGSKRRGKDDDDDDDDEEDGPDYD